MPRLAVFVLARSPGCRGGMRGTSAGVNVPHAIVFNCVCQGVIRRPLWGVRPTHAGFRPVSYTHLTLPTKRIV